MIVVWHEPRQRFEAITSYLERNVPKESRWRWDPLARRWYAPSEDIARRLARFAQGPAATRLATLSPEEQASLSASLAKDLLYHVHGDLTLPCPPGLAYLPYQKAGIAYALSRPHTLIADEMGLGKTIQAIGVVNALVGIAHDGDAGQPSSRLGIGLFGNRADTPPARVLIVTPASLRLNWRAEWRRWHTGKLRPVLLDEWPGGLFDHTAGKALIVSYDSLRKWHPQIAATEWDILIADEAHLVKDASTRRAKTLFGGNYKRESYEPIEARRKLFLTGTAIVNKPDDLWPLVHALDPEGLGKNHADFRQRYDTFGGNLDELHLRLRTRIMVRRKKEDVLKDLPKKRRQVVLLDVPNAGELLEAEGRAISLQQVMLEKTRAEIAGLSHQEQVLRLRQCRAIALSEIARVRHETALAKLPQAIEHISEVLGNVEKAVVFAHHHDVVDGLCAEFRRVAVKLDGRDDPTNRQKSVDQFQRERGTRLFIGSIRAAGLGITLTAASVVVFVELDWTPAAMMQSEDRLHRIGQVNPVLVQHLVIDGSIDSKMAKILIDKQAMMDAALDGGPSEESRADILTEVLRA